YVAVVGIDGSGAATAYYPFGSREPAAIAPGGDAVLPGAIALDAAPGDERFYAVFAERPFAIDAALFAGLRGEHTRAGLTIAAAGPGAQSEGRRGGDAGGAERRVVPVQVAPAERKDLPIWLEGLGTVAAVQQVTVRPQVDGRIDKVLFVEGQPVKRGDVLVQIDPRPFQVALHQAQGALARDKAQLETNQVNLKRYEGLKAQN